MNRSQHPTVPRSVSSLAAALLNEHPPTTELGLRLAEVSVVVRSNSPGLIATLRGYFGGFVDDGITAATAGVTTIFAIDGPPPPLPPEALTVRPPEPGKRSLKEAYLDTTDGRIIRKLKTGAVFLIGGDLHLAIGDLQRLVNQVVNFINNRFIEARLRGGWRLCHAAAVARGDRGLILAGFSGMGKSTLALHLLEHDLDYVSNDRVLIAAGERPGELRACGVPKLPRTNPGTALSIPRLRPILPAERRATLGAMPTAELWEIEEKYDVDVDALYGAGRIRLEAPAQTLMILNWQRGPGSCTITKIDLAERPELLEVVMKTAGLFYEEREGAPPAAPIPADYLALFAEFAVFELSGAVDFAAAVSFACDRLGVPSATPGADA